MKTITALKAALITVLVLGALSLYFHLLLWLMVYFRPENVFYITTGLFVVTVFTVTYKLIEIKK